jgi:hypothetical protein
MFLSTFFLQADPAAFEYFLNHPLIFIGALVLAVGFLEIGSKLMKWIEHTIKDDFFSRILIIISMIGLLFLFLALVYQLEGN